MKSGFPGKAIVSLIIATIMVACIDKNVYKGDKEPDKTPPPSTYSAYLYPFNDEVQNAVVEIVIQSKTEVKANDIIAEIPYLKYNKSWLFILTQDDCKHAAYCRTWAAINGKPISSSELYPTKPNPSDLYYDAAQLDAGDLPPTIIQPSGTLGSTDGNGNEVRFAFTTTLSPEEDWMNSKPNINLGYTNNYYRFYMKKGLIWDNVKEMLNYGTGIALHDMKTSNTSDPITLLEHFHIAQSIINEKLSGRGSKFLAEPNGNKTYITAAKQYDDIQTMTAQSGGITLYPFKVTDDLRQFLIQRDFIEPDNIKQQITTQLALPKEERKGICIGVHSTDNTWVDFLKWLNNSYGKDGDDSVWFPSQEEYYEYNYYRINGSVNTTQVNKNTIKLTIQLPSGKNFYYPSISVNLDGIKKEEITSISSSNTVTGFSYGNYKNGLTMNIDCRKHLYDHAAHYVERYLKEKSNKNKKADARYFVNMLKESSEKNGLLKQLE